MQYTTETTEEQTVEEITYRRKKQKGRKAELIKDLPVKEVHCQLHGDDCLCDHCGSEMKQMGKKLFVKKFASCQPIV